MIFPAIFVLHTFFRPFRSLPPPSPLRVRRPILIEATGLFGPGFHVRPVPQARSPQAVEDEHRLGEALVGVAPEVKDLDVAVSEAIGDGPRGDQLLDVHLTAHRRTVATSAHPTPGKTEL